MCCKLCFYTQDQVKEELEKKKRNVEELNNAKTVLEKNNRRLTSELKTVTEKSEKVSYLSRRATRKNALFDFKEKREAGIFFKKIKYNDNSVWADD